MPYSPQTRRQLAFVSILVAIGAFFVVREALEHYRNAARLVAFRAAPACMAPFAFSRPAGSALCHDVSAVVTARWSRRRSRSRLSNYYLALRLPDGFVDTVMLVGRASSWENASLGTTLIVRQFAARDWVHPRVIALVANGTVASTDWTSKHPVWRDKPSELLLRGLLIVALGAILLIMLWVFGRAEEREDSQPRFYAT